MWQFPVLTEVLSSTFQTGVQKSQAEESNKDKSIPINSCSSILKHEAFMDKSSTRMHPSSDASSTLSDVHQSTSKIRKFTFLPLLKLLTICIWKSSGFFVFLFFFLAASPSSSVRLCHAGPGGTAQNSRWKVKLAINHFNNIFSGEKGI